MVFKEFLNWLKTVKDADKSSDNNQKCTQETISPGRRILEKNSIQNTEDKQGEPSHFNDKLMCDQIKRS